MIGRKVTVFTAVAAVLVSSIAGSTFLGNGSASADAVGTVRDLIDNGRDALVDTARDEATTVAEQLVSGDTWTKADDGRESALQRAAIGLGEKLVLVIADKVSPSTAPSALASANVPFGQLDGFHVDTSDNYALSGLYIQQSPDAVLVSCESLDGCPDGVTQPKELQAVSLRLVTLNQFTYSSFPASCGAVGLPPCQAERYRQMLGDPPSISAGHSLLLTAFRTKAGAERFIEFARNAGITGMVTVQATKLGGGDVGLGQEEHPDGSGPLEVPLPNAEAYQR